VHWLILKPRPSISTWYVDIRTPSPLLLQWYRGLARLTLPTTYVGLKLLSRSQLKQGMSDNACLLRIAHICCVTFYFTVVVDLGDVPYISS